MNKPVRKAFTLIELLVVIAILALLIAVLVPSLGRAREIALRLTCGTNMRAIAQAGWLFAGEHGGRGPGAAHRYLPSNSSISWADILNQECFKSDRIVRIGTRPVKNKLYCTVMAPYGGNLYPRAYVWNLHAQGGYNWSGNPPEGPYGLNVDPAKEQPFWGNNILDFYALGAPLEKFPQPSYKFLVAENERANDNFFTTNTAPPYSVDLTGPATGYPPWSGDGGVWAFRHLKPPAANMYKTQATANFAFIDCHVEVMNPQGKILDIYRSSMD